MEAGLGGCCGSVLLHLPTISVAICAFQGWPLDKLPDASGPDSGWPETR